MSVMDREQKHRARARLALRAEQAFGLRSLPLRDGLNAEASVESSEIIAEEDANLFRQPSAKQRAQVTLLTLDASNMAALSRKEKLSRLRELDARKSPPA